jgi:hypothetical protein
MTIPRIVARDCRAIPARWNHFVERGVLGGESRRQRRLEEADMSRTVVDAADLERRVKDMYTQVALDPQGRFHFEMGREMARRLGYSDVELHAAPAESIESFAGVGYYFDLADLHRGEQVVDMGSDQTAPTRGTSSARGHRTDMQLPDAVTCDATLWAACVGGAMQREAFVEAIEQAGLAVTIMKANHEYRFLSKSARTPRTTTRAQRVAARRQELNRSRTECMRR